MNAKLFKIPKLLVVEHKIYVETVMTLSRNDQIDKNSASYYINLQKIVRESDASF